MTLGDRIRKRREELGLQQVDVSRIVGIAQSSLSLIESGQTKTLRAATLMGLSKALKTNTKWIMTGRGQHETDPLQTEQDQKLLEAWLALNEANRGAVLVLLESLVKSQPKDKT